MGNYLGSDDLEALDSVQRENDIFAADCCVDDVNVIVRTLEEYAQPGLHTDVNAEFEENRTYDDLVCPDRPLEPKRRLFISAFPDSETGLFFEVSSTTISNRIKAILDTVGIDVSKFQSHILRSASIAAARGHTDEALDSVLSRAAVSEKVFSSFYDLPISS